MFPRQIYHCWLLPKQSRELVVVNYFLGHFTGCYRWAWRCPSARLPTIQFSITQKCKYWKLDQPAKYFLLKSSPSFEFQMNCASRVEVSWGDTVLTSNLIISSVFPETSKTFAIVGGECRVRLGLGQWQPGTWDRGPVTWLRRRQQRGVGSWIARQHCSAAQL